MPMTLRVPIFRRLTARLAGREIARVELQVIGGEVAAQPQRDLESVVFRPVLGGADDTNIRHRDRGNPYAAGDTDTVGVGVLWERRDEPADEIDEKFLGIVDVEIQAVQPVPLVA